MLWANLLRDRKTSADWYGTGTVSTEKQDESSRFSDHITRWKFVFVGCWKSSPWAQCFITIQCTGQRSFSRNCAFMLFCSLTPSVLSVTFQSGYQSCVVLLGTKSNHFRWLSAVNEIRRFLMLQAWDDITFLSSVAAEILGRENISCTINFRTAWIMSKSKV